LPTRPTTIVEEFLLAARGCFALVVGNRKAPDFFDFSRRGLAGSFIALLVAQLITSYGPLLLGAQPEPGAITRLLTMSVILFVAQVGFSAIVLRQIGRLDGLVPYLVADNWATFFLTIFTAIIGNFGLGNGELVLFGILVLVIEINIARLIVTLTALQIAMFLIAQLVGISLGLILIGAVFPVPDVPAAQ
jgi:hypothetical protein